MILSKFEIPIIENETGKNNFHFFKKQYLSKAGVIAKLLYIFLSMSDIQSYLTLPRPKSFSTIVFVLQSLTAIAIFPDSHFSHVISPEILIHADRQKAKQHRIKK